MGTRNVPPFRNDVVGSFLRPQVIHEARRNLEAGKITASELRQIEDEEIKELVAKEIENGLHAENSAALTGIWTFLKTLKE